MTYAIIEAGGTQIKVEPGRFYDINLLPVDPESNYTVDKVLLVNNNDEITVGQPYIEGATVEGTVLRRDNGGTWHILKKQNDLLGQLDLESEELEFLKNELASLNISDKISDKLLGEKGWLQKMLRR